MDVMDVMDVKFIAGFITGAFVINIVHFVAWVTLPNYPYFWNTKAQNRKVTGRKGAR